MRIKHWQGYGTVNARKINDGSCTLHVQVVGNHEWGLVRRDTYDLFNWLVKRFDKSQTDYISWNNKLENVRFEEGETVVNGIDTDTCDYYFSY